MEEIIWVVLLGYFVLGITALVILDLLTKRVRTRLKDASYDAQSKLAGNMVFVNSKIARAVLIVSLILLWPVAIYGAITSIGGDNG
jgi:NADH:ubiquinone oxidoreductase subunit 3 (subunit A)